MTERTTSWFQKWTAVLWANLTMQPTLYCTIFLYVSYINWTAKQIDSHAFFLLN
uniref:Uncharacterized protein n=1 Tax=Anguilla anguilla TaxID=7936 RepID=A0A0E9QI01_ANGAN